MDIVTSYDNWGGSGDRRNILSGNSEVFDGTETTYLSYGNGAQINIDIVFSGLEGKLYIDCIKVVRTNYGFINREILLNGKSIGTFNDNVDYPLPMLTIRKNDKLTIKGKNNETGGGTYPTIIREIYLKTFLVPDKSFIFHNGEYKKYENIPLEDIQFEDAIPKMTSNTTPTGIASASSTNTATTVQPSAPWYAFDKTSSKDHTQIWYANAVVPQWLEYEFLNAQKIAKYSILRRTNRFEGSPNSWEFQAFNETTKTWDILDSISNFQMTNSGYYEFLIDWSKQGAYKKYRIYITATQANEPPMVNELIMYKASATPVPPKWSTVSNTLPTSTQFLERGMYLSPLLDRRLATLEPIAMIQRNDILDVGEVGKIFSETIDLKKYIDIRSIRVEVK